MILAKPAWAAFKNMLRAAIRNPLWAFLSLIAAPFRVWKPLLQSFFILFVILFVVGLGGRMVLRDFGGFGPGSIPVIAWDGVTLLIMAATAFRLITAPLILHFGDVEGDTHGSARFATGKETAVLTRADSGLLIGRDPKSKRLLRYDGPAHLLTMAPTRTGKDEALKTKLSEKAKRGRILKLILFGSYARGDWVEDRKSGYLSDYDLLIVVNEERFAEQYEAWEKAGERFVQELTITRQLATPVNFIVHSYQDVNAQLAQGRPFFVDIARDGVVLYEAPGFPLAAPKVLTPEEARELAQRYFEQWFPDTAELLAGAEFYRDRGNLNLAAFQLHQAAERLYHCTLLVMALYSPKSHKLTFLRSQAERIAPLLIDIWPRDSRFAKRSFTRLDRAYVDARYSPAWGRNKVCSKSCAKVERTVTPRLEPA